MKALSIRGRLILSFTVLLVLVVAGLTAPLLNNLSRVIARAEERELSGYVKSLQAAIDSRNRSASLLATFVAQMDEAKIAFAARDREGLQARFLPPFTAIKTLGMEQFQFHLAPATSFLRLHMPKKFGDDLSAFRQTVVEANRRQELVAGLEKGVAGLGVRAVAPVKSEAGHLGTVEFGMDVGQIFVDDFKRVFGVDVTVLLPVGNDYKMIASTQKEPTLNADDWRAASSGGLVMRHLWQDSIPHTAALGVLTDYSGKPAAVVEIIMDSSEYQAQYAAARNQAVLIALAVLVTGLIIAWVVARGITAPLAAVKSVMDRLSRNENVDAVPFVEQRDEVGEMARAIEIFKRNSEENRVLHDEQVLLRVQVEQERHRVLDSTADALHASIGQVAKDIGSASSDLLGVANTMSRIVGDADQGAGRVAAAAEVSSENVQSVAAAAEQLSHSIREISRQTEESTAIAHSAVQRVGEADTAIGGLNTAAQSIGEVVTLINRIAGQTNLLALNATIEAARAGDSGKGFAVVAAEVKQLAHQTALATNQITSQISAVQLATSTASSAIQSIGDVVRRMDGIIGSISEAVTQQGSATQEIASNVHRAAEGTREVSEHIASVSAAIAAADEAARTVLSDGESLATQVGTLRGEVDRTVDLIRSA